MAKGRTEVPERFRSGNGGGRAASEKQIKWILDMFESKDLMKDPRWFDATNAMDMSEYATYIEYTKQRIAEKGADGEYKMRSKRASELIDALRPLPNLAAQTLPERKPAVDVMAGRTRVEYEVIETDKGERRVGRIITEDGDRVLAGSYGLPTDDDDRFANNMSFFRVWVGDRGGWNVQLYVSDDLTRVELAWETKLDVLWAIAQNPEAASANFGHEFKRCGICGRGLTNDESRERGIGPVCAGRL